MSESSLDASSDSCGSDMSGLDEEMKNESTKIPKRQTKADTGGLQQFKPSVPLDKDKDDPEKKRLKAERKAKRKAEKKEKKRLKKLSMQSEKEKE